MKLYVIFFEGYYPIGAVALASGNTPEEAIQELLDFPEFADFKRNPKNNTELHAEEVPYTECSSNYVNILLNGNY